MRVERHTHNTFYLRHRLEKLTFLWPPYVLERPLYFCRVISIFSSFFPRLISAVGDWMSTILPHVYCGLSANLECMSEMCCMRLAENTGRKLSPFQHHRTTLSGCIFATKPCIDNRKNLLNSNTSSTCPHNMVNFGLVAH